MATKTKKKTTKRTTTSKTKKARVGNSIFQDIESAFRSRKALTRDQLVDLIMKNPNCAMKKKEDVNKTVNVRLNHLKSKGWKFKGEKVDVKDGDRVMKYTAVKVPAKS